jgi:hypothetical protein
MMRALVAASLLALGCGPPDIAIIVSVTSLPSGTKYLDARFWVNCTAPETGSTKSWTAPSAGLGSSTSFALLVPSNTAGNWLSIGLVARDTICALGTGSSERSVDPQGGSWSIVMDDPIGCSTKPPFSPKCP